ncbi:hypothetical protein G5V58_01065 [Nocardioides anomalus]|uniref:Uncharacterized protein n=1 Tax=Nocardioides anomalus TaxID=2712223 RepID=A0A6G6W8W6_9ACTN|nr:hypothetical protein [Nocardioides anomalus]QIG41545.1 hypothetical protein G5V58_01065 [Nocardioides anomalus]
MSPRTVLAATAAAALVALTAPPAHALPPTSRSIEDPVDKTAAYDIVGVSLRSAPTSKRPAVVKVTHDRRVAAGDAVDVWFDLDGDKVPDVHLSGSAFSEYVVRRAKSFTADGKDLSELDCVRLSMAGTTSKIRVFPACLGDPVGFAVAVKSSVGGEPAATVDWAPGTERFTKKVLAAPLS